MQGKAKLRVLGLDLGDRRIGVAISDPSCKLALWSETLFVSGERDAQRRIGDIVREHGINRIVVGLPLNLDGSVGFRAEKTQAFAGLLRDRLKVEVLFWDERLTTSIAKRTLHDAGRKATKRDGNLDQMSAVLILQGYLDRLATLPTSSVGAVHEPPSE